MARLTFPMILSQYGIQIVSTNLVLGLQTYRNYHIDEAALLNIYPRELYFQMLAHVLALVSFRGRSKEIYHIMWTKSERQLRFTWRELQAMANGLSTFSRKLSDRLVKTNTDNQNV